MPVKDADPEAATLTDAFSAAMDAPPAPREPAAPPAIDPDAPHGRDEETGEPLAPFGLTKEGRPRKSAAGRKPGRDDQPRTGEVTRPKADEPKAGRMLLEPKNFAAPLGELADSAWMALTFGAQLPLGQIPLLSRLPAGKGRTLGELLTSATLRIEAQAALLMSNRDGLVAAVNISAQHSPRARRLVERLEAGDITWCLMAGTLAAPFLVQTRMLWAGQLSVEQLAEGNRREFKDFTDRLLAQVADQAALAEAAAAATAGRG
ncbi:MAG TPA: hypothetical protein VGG25_10265 [Streptosporangiaceae bacterium]|jgi:hypothetical protein